MSGRDLLRMMCVIVIVAAVASLPKGEAGSHAPLRADALTALALAKLDELALFVVIDSRCAATRVLEDDLAGILRIAGHHGVSHRLVVLGPHDPDLLARIASPDHWYLDGDGALAKALGIQFVPTVLVVDAEGVRYTITSGDDSWPAFDQLDMWLGRTITESSHES